MVKLLRLASLGLWMVTTGLVLSPALAWAAAQSISPSATEESPVTYRRDMAQVNPPLPTNPAPGSTPVPESSDPFLQPAPLPLPVSPPETPVLEPSPTPTPAPSPVPAPDAPTVFVNQIDVLGSSAFSEEQLQEVVQSFEGRSLTLEELQEVADRITQLYLNEGYLTSRAVLVDQDVVDGTVQVQVIEGSLESIEIEGNERVRDSYIRSRVALGAGTPLNQFTLEDQLRLLRLNPLFENVEASLRAGSGLGQSILTVRVTEANPFSGSVSLDNYSPASVGSERMNLELGYRNLTGFGDELLAAYRRTTTGGSSLFDFNYRIPVNPMEGTIALRAAPSDFQITDPEFDQLDISGNTDLYEISFRQPLWRSPREEFALSLGFSYRDGETLFENLVLDESTTSVFRFGQDLVRRDPQGAWALRSQFSLGTGLLDATTSGRPDGEFFSWLAQIQRVQTLGTNHLLILQGDLQLTPDPLLASEQLALGGGQSLRGFRQNARLGDNGFRISAEDRITLARNESGASTFQVAPFVDFGAVWNDPDNPVETPDQSFLAGIGVGLLWQPTSQFQIRVDATVPLVDLADRGENAQDEGIYFNVNYSF
ncbi:MULTISPECIES: ShlB/FhaC/HecB family hemolysin secretion/activation protein [unclassified Leptolyngbya]|uniref:ShlB/FhaC/HecB family hemolysin secretion/activation protein n=1 Tax=unclassified Leptolyngbya TaxID=2650499 RepID=UPI0016841DA3|nr:MULTISPECIES: ShlB/FhaC/HecB family hemolysin secretion/activation protein [unclassified Leptolyngbya]MBD1913737.1 ShlB/FhaC/HecB family hemolysin secretion/activation protein [Leptolyngbya sp. FACHB-8]MBD2153227.1 ShlB/FhaC/HecB family hemolysin secretion/activation protein [Leptolyngbya sp. FACHB-16]